MKRKLLTLALIIIAFCLLTPCVSANAQVNQVKQTSTDTETITDAYELDPSYYPYTQVKLSITFTSTINLMYNQVTDAKGHVHINGKASERGSVYGEGWVYDNVRQVWVLGLYQAQSSKMFLSVNELTLDSETHTSQEIRVLANKVNASTLDLGTGQIITLDVLMIDHVMIKLNNGEVQFEKSWEILHNQ